MIRNRYRRNGFTLIEVLVVVLIAAIVFSVMFTVLGTSFEVLRVGESRAQLNNNTRSALDYIVDDISTATMIPLEYDRDLNGYPDDQPYPAGGQGYDEDAVWRVAWRVNNQPVISAGYFLSCAWSDRLRLTHQSLVAQTPGGSNQTFAVPKAIRRDGARELVYYDSLQRLVLPASADMPYYLSGEWDRNGDSVFDATDQQNSGPGTGFGVIEGYPDLVVSGAQKETAVLVQDLFYAFADSPDVVRRERQIPISGNITRIKYEYLHEVPVYLSRVNGSNVEICYQSLLDGSINWIAANDERSNEMVGMEPMVDHWEMRQIDVAFNGTNGFFVDGQTGAQYGGFSWKLQDTYPEGHDPLKLTGDHVAPPTGVGLGQVTGGALTSGWNCAVFDNIDSNGDGVNDNSPIDRLAYVTTSVSGGEVIDGGIAELRPDMERLHGTGYYQLSLSPSGVGDLGDADGIPDGDGIPDDPVPGWWLPYMRAVRVTVVATPREVIEERRSKSGKVGKSGSTVYYRLDSPVPFSDQGRTQPLYNQTADFIGVNKDLVMTRTVPINSPLVESGAYPYYLELMSSPRDSRIQERRVDQNVFDAVRILFRDPLDPSATIRASTPSEKLQEKNPVSN
ncbi:MAG: prepilin-type N-terminal cleavage/methylation domain-containing protein [bacterium]